MDGLLLLPQPREVSIDPSRRLVPAEVVSEEIDHSLPPEGYRLAAGADGVRIRGADRQGLRHATSTLAQLERLAGLGALPAGFGPAGMPLSGSASPPMVPACTITDWPEFRIRGMMLDVSRCRVPTLGTLERMIALLGEWKFNQLHLYMEHTFAYRGHEAVWEEADPYTAEDIADLEQLCRAAGLDLVPHQNTLGHMERWLAHEPYRSLAISPEGFYWLLGIFRQPMTLDPAKEGSFSLVASLLGQLLPNFTSPYVHLGMDVPFVLSPDRAGEWTAWLERLLALDGVRDRSAMVWGDYLDSHPALLDTMLAGVTVCEWGYEAGHAWPQVLARLAEREIASVVSPGTSSWISFAGRVDNALRNVREAAIAGREAGSVGMLMTDWGDMGHHQALATIFPGVAAAAACSWNPGAAGRCDPGAISELLSLHLFQEALSGEPAGGAGAGAAGGGVGKDAEVSGANSRAGAYAGALTTLGQAAAMVAPRPPNMSALALNLLLPQLPVGTGLTTNLSVDDLGRVEEACDDAVSGVVRAGAVRAPDGAVIREEIEITRAWLALSVHDAVARLEGDGSIGSVQGNRRRDLDREAGELTDHYREVWLRRNRPGGLDESVAWIDHLRSCYRDGAAEPSWFGPRG